MYSPIHWVGDSCDPIDSKNEPCQKITCGFVSIAWIHFILQLTEGLHQIYNTSWNCFQAADKGIRSNAQSSKVLGHANDNENGTNEL